MNVNKEEILAATKAVVQTRKFQLIAVGVTSSIASGTLGYIVGKRNGDVFNVVVTNEELSDRVIDDIESVVTVPLGERLSPKELNEALDMAEAIIEEQGYEDESGFYDEYELDLDAIEAIEEDEVEDGLPLVDNVFAGSDDEWDYETELALRDPALPYIIHVDEFKADEMHYPQSTFTYYAGDDIMTDEADNVIYGWAEMMGELDFGHGSGDPSAVYIRNERLMLEWEVLRHSSSYEVEVQGLSVEAAYEAEDELRHSRYANSRLSRELD